MSNPVSGAYINLVVAVNDAQTAKDHRENDCMRQGFLACLTLIRGQVSAGQLLMEADRHYLNQGIERPMCGGVWLDWEAR